MCALPIYPGLDAVDKPDAYIFQTASNALKDLQRRDAVRFRHGGVSQDDGLEEQARSDLSPERVLLGRQAVAQLSAALRELPERTRRSEEPTSELPSLMRISYDVFCL